MYQDLLQKDAAKQINSQIIDKLSTQSRYKVFKSSNWGSIKIGDVLKIKLNQEVPCDCLILNIIGSKLENQTCYEINSLWNENPAQKKSY